MIRVVIAMYFIGVFIGWSVTYNSYKDDMTELSELRVLKHDLDNMAGVIEEMKLPLRGDRG